MKGQWGGNVPLFLNMTTELLTDPGHTRADLKMIQKAIKNEWEIPEQLMSALPKVAGSMALNGSAKEKIEAMKVLLAMKAQNDRANAEKQPGQTINVGVNVENRSEQPVTALQFVKQFREARGSDGIDAGGIRRLPENT